jgi:hypothetical protein
MSTVEKLAVYGEILTAEKRLAALERARLEGRAEGIQACIDALAGGLFTPKGPIMISDGTAAAQRLKNLRDEGKLK